MGWSLAASSVALRQMTRARRASPDTAATCQEGGGEGEREGTRHISNGSCVYIIGLYNIMIAYTVYIWFYA